MGVFAGPDTSESGLVLALDAGNKKSYSQNEFRYSTDIFGWCSAAGLNACTISRDTISSPVGDAPLRMVVTGNDPHVGCYNTPTYNIAPAVNGQTWIVSAYVRANVATTGELFIFSANSSGDAFANNNITASTITITTDWTRVQHVHTMNSANTAFIQVRLDGPNSGGAEQTIWWDGLQIERVPSGTTSATPFTSSYYGGTVFRDLSGNNNTGTLTNYPTYSGNNVGSIVFDGTDDYIPIGTSRFSYGSSPGTLSAWANATSATAGNGNWIISYGTSVASQARFIGVYNQTYYFGGWANDITAVGFQTNTWFNMVGVYDGTNASMYINGVLVSGPTAKTWNTIANTAQIGRQVYAGEYWNGRIANVSVYNRALTAAEIQQNFNATRSRFGI